MNQFERIASIIRYLDAHHTEQPDLAALSAEAGLSASHFHRLFSAWAGITPKDFLQCLTVAHARELLAQGQSVLEAALQAGLSGPGRLHDLCVNLEAASPGELKSGGADWVMTGGYAESPFGLCLFGESPRGICHLSFIESGREEEAWSEMTAAWPHARWRRDDRAVARQVGGLFIPPAQRKAPLQWRALVRGTEFQLRVWRALVQIPPGQLVSYSQVAVTIGHPTAVRAVGTAIGRNAIAYLIPCHRVIRDTGVLGQYRWGELRKKMLIAWETPASKLTSPSLPAGKSRRQPDGTRPTSP